MALTSDEIESIAKDILNGVKPKLSGQDVDDFVVAFRIDMVLAKKNKWIIDLPFEVPDISDTKLLK